VEDSSPNWAFLNYKLYTPGTTIPDCPSAWPNNTITIAYTAVGNSDEIIPWSSAVSATLIVQGPYNTVNGGRQGYTILAASGTRVFTLNGVSTTQRIVGTSSADLFDNNIYSQPPYDLTHTLQLCLFLILYSPHPLLVTRCLLCSKVCNAVRRFLLLIGWACSIPQRPFCLFTDRRLQRQRRRGVRDQRRINGQSQHHRLHLVQRGQQ
jgi:hypothetical protein